MSITANVIHLTLVALFSLALLGALLVLEYRRPNPARRTRRMIAATLATLSLMLIGLDFTIEGKRSPMKKNNEAIFLITANPDPDTLRTAQAALNPIKLYSLGGTRFENAEPIYDAGEILRAHETDFAAGAVLHLFGDGLEQADLTRLSGVSMVYHPSAIQTGIGEIAFPEKISLGGSMDVSGVLTAESAGSVGNNPSWLRLETPSGKKDSVRVDSGVVRFRFSDTPREAGEFFYRLVYGTRIETLAVQVVPPQKMSVLILESAPTFETKYLKQFFAQRGFRVVSRTTVTQKETRDDAINLPKEFQKAAVASYQLIITDMKRLASLTTDEARQLQTAVTERGAGILITDIDSSAIRSQRVKALFPFSLVPLFDEETRRAELMWNQTMTDEIGVEPFSISQDAGIKFIVRDKAGRGIAAVAPIGNGRVGFSLVSASYEWQLAGKETSYAAYWSQVVSELTSDLSEQWRYEPLMFCDKPSRFMLSTDSLQPKLITDGDTVGMVQDTRDARLWHGTIWFTSSGWKRISQGGAADERVYVYERTAWRGVQQAATQSVTRRAMMLRRANRITESLTSDTASIKSAIESDVPPNPVWTALLFGLFLIAAAYLWVEGKW
jgi:hypothetical protein